MDRASGDLSVRRFTGALIAITAFGAVLRFFSLGSRDLWYDVSCTYIYIKHLFDWPFASSFLVESTNAPYYLLLWVWTGLFGIGEAAMRSMSALFAAATIPLLALAARQVADRREALVAACLLAANPLHVYYAHEARAYALWVFLLTLALWLLLRAARRNRFRDWLAWSAAIAAALPTHYFTAFFLPASIASVRLAQNRRVALRGWFIAVVLAGAAFVPYAMIAVLPAAGGGQRWVAEGFDALLAVPQTLASALPGGPFPSHLRGLSLDAPDTRAVLPIQLVRVAAWVAGALVLLPIAAALRPAGSRLDGSDSPADGPDENVGSTIAPAANWVLLFLSLGPLLFAWAYSLALRPIYLPGRYDLVAFPAITLLIGILGARGVRRLIPRASGAQWGWAIALVALSMPACARFVALRPPPSLPRVRAEWLAQNSSAGDYVITFRYDRDGLLYYFDRSDGSAEVLSFPGWLDGQIGWVDSETDLERAGELTASASVLAGRAAAALDAGRAVLILLDGTTPPEDSAAATVNGVLREALTAHGIQMRLASRDLMILETRLLPR